MGKTRSCGCLRAETHAARLTTHGHAPASGRGKEYWTWAHIVQRCTNPKSRDFAWWGGRGIKICDEWRGNFAAFLRDVGPAPSPSHSLDRFPDNDGDYKQGNVRWATKRQQARNCRTNVYVNYRGISVCMAEAAERSGIALQTVWARRARGWPDDRLFDPVRPLTRKRRKA